MQRSLTIVLSSFTLPFFLWSCSDSSISPEPPAGTLTLESGETVTYWQDGKNALRLSMPGEDAPLRVTLKTEYSVDGEAKSSHKLFRGDELLVHESVTVTDEHALDVYEIAIGDEGFWFGTISSEGQLDVSIGYQAKGIYKNKNWSIDLDEFENEAYRKQLKRSLDAFWKEHEKQSQILEDPKLNLMGQVIAHAAQNATLQLTPGVQSSAGSGQLDATTAIRRICATTEVLQRTLCSKQNPPGFLKTVCGLIADLADFCDAFELLDIWELTPNDPVETDRPCPACGDSGP